MIDKPIIRCPKGHKTLKLFYELTDDSIVNTKKDDNIAAGHRRYCEECNGAIYNEDECKELK